MSDKKQSSVNFLKSKLITRQNTHIIHGEEVIFISLEKLNNLFEQSKAMHKEEVKKHFNDGYDNGGDNWGDGSGKTAEQYYNKTYGE